MGDISFTDVKGEYGWLGNMSPHMVEYNDEWYRTAEALFQCMRYEGFPLVQGEIKVAKSPMTAKMVAKRHRALIADKTSADDWEANESPLQNSFSPHRPALTDSVRVVADRD